MGSSPQVRGPPPDTRSIRDAVRLIPAGAGTTHIGVRGAGRLRAHPRRCGDHANLTKATLIYTGSSPQVRGPLRRVCSPAPSRGLIPAGAGTTIWFASICTVSRAHPRRCGDHKGQERARPCRAGSSPQVRGPRVLTSLAAPSPGLIPAGAGTTYRLSARFPRTGAHPRRCGDHPLILDLSGTLSGSSPQVRGPLPVWKDWIRGLRLIPAGAGTTHQVSAVAAAGTAHPRRCGNHPAAISRAKSQMGSSPQVREPLNRVLRYLCRHGLIPAGAGTTHSDGQGVG